MAKVVAIMSMSLDGYVADASDGVAEVFDWYFSGDVEVSTASKTMGMTFHVSPPSADHLRGLEAEVGAMLTGRRTFEVADGWGGQHPWDVPAFVVTHHVPEGWPRPARRSSSSPTASAPLLERDRLPARSPWECTAPERSSSAWTPGCSTRSTSIWLPCCSARECGSSTTSRTHRSSSGIRQSSPVWVSRICAIPCTRRRPPGSCDHESVRMLVAALLTPALLVACTDDGRPAPTRRGRSRSRAGQPLRARRRR